MLKRTILALMLTCLVPLMAVGQTPETILRTADAYRAPFDSMGISVTANTQSATGTDTRTYSVAYKDGVNTLIAFESPANSAGDLVLMSGDDIYFYAQDTRQPIRITPMQRLNGAVSYGDLARLAWSTDYTVAGTESTQYNGQSVLDLSLVARTRGATYQTISLRVDPQSYRPVAADVFLASGKLFKTLTFTRYSNVNGRPMNTELRIVDHVSGGSSILQFSNVQSRNWPNRLFVRTGLPNVNPAELR